ncbi:lipopolysaccharide biosynthesis protein [Aurantiacibacter odishensis]|uniref:lipopolysaccharide biosynthesis protein n=1 Tax=Aurantiacibacter odishensis TaxID=1155476 RepID=UPI0013C5316E|nr:lipopolysaccharide biosynthesis protein [Aurantiacibacter odishensis]
MWIGGSRLLVNALGVVSLFVLARLLMPEDFGLVAIGTTLAILSKSLTELSLGQALIQHADPERRHVDTVFTLNLIRSFVVGLIFFFGAPLVSAFYGDDRLTEVVWIVGICVFLAGLQNPKLNLLKRDLQFWQEFVLLVGAKLTMVVSSIVLAIIYDSYWALLGGMVAAEVVGLIASYACAPYRPRLRLKEFREFLSFSGWLSLDQIVRTINFRMDPLIVGRFVGSSQLGLFTVSLNLSKIPTRELTVPLTTSLFPAFSKLTHDKKRLTQAYYRAQTLLFTLALPAGVLLSLVARPLIEVALGEAWYAATPLVQVLAVIAAARSIAAPSQALALATGDTRLLFNRSLQALVYRLPLVIAGLALGGLEGLLWSLSIVSVLGIALDTNVVSRLIGFGLVDHFKANWRSILACLVMSAAVIGTGLLLPEMDTLLLRIVELLFLCAVGGAIYPATLFGLWHIGKRPNGAEVEILALASGALRRIGAMIGIRPQPQVNAEK